MKEYFKEKVLFLKSKNSFYRVQKQVNFSQIHVYSVNSQEVKKAMK